MTGSYIKLVMFTDLIKNCSQRRLVVMLVTDGGGCDDDGDRWWWCWWLLALAAPEGRGGVPPVMSHGGWILIT